MTRTKIYVKSFSFFLMTAFCALPSFAKRTALEAFSQNVCIDMPEGYGIIESGDNGNFYILQNSVAPCKALIRVYQKGRFKNTREALETTLSNLSLSYECDEFLYHQNTAAIATLSGSFLNEEISGYATALIVPENEKILVTLSWCEKSYAGECNSFIASFIDAQYVDTLSYFDRGPLTSYVVPESGEELSVTLTIDSKIITSSIDKNSEEGAQYVIEREYEVSTFYASSPLWAQAWQRYYRLIFRDSCTRLQKVSFDVYNALAPECADETEYAQKLLNWTQGFSYERDTNRADFTSLPSILQGAGSDCDSRSLLLCVMLQSMNIDSVMFVSAEYSHAIAGLVSTHPGYAFKIGEKNYLTGDTTVTGLTWGKLGADIADQSRWICVMLP